MSYPFRRTQRAVFFPVPETAERYSGLHKFTPAILISNYLDSNVHIVGASVTTHSKSLKIAPPDLQEIIYTDANAYFDGIRSAINQAKESVNLEVYIFDHDD